MSLFAKYTSQVIEQMGTDTQSVFNKVRLRFIGRHILMRV